MPKYFDRGTVARVMNLENLFYKMKYKSLIVLYLMVVSIFTGCGSHENAQATTETDVVQDNNVEIAQTNVEADDNMNNNTAAEESLNAEENTATTEERSMENMLKLFINDEEIQVKWEENESVEGLRNLAKESPVIIDMSMYGGFEQVGSIGQSLPRNDKQMTTSAGDIVLYSGNQLVVFYGSNSWAYTKLGHIDGKTEDQLGNVLGSGGVTLTLKVE